jgi:hypothetical protein
MNASLRRVRRCVLVLVGMLAPACSWLGASDIEPDAIANLPVVDDDRPFDPSQAVDDDDDLERPWLRAEDEQEQDAFANDGTPAAEAHPTETAAAADAPAQRGDAPRAGDATSMMPPSAASTPGPTSEPASPPAARERAAATKRTAPPAEGARAGDVRSDDARADAKRTARTPRAPRDAKERPRDGEVGPQIPEDEHIATPEDVEALRAERRRKLDELAAAKGDDDAKLALARNPPPEPIGKSKSTAWTVTDYALEGVLLAVAAGVVAGAWTLARSFPKSVASVVVAGVFVVVLVVTQGE